MIRRVPATVLAAMAAMAAVTLAAAPASADVGPWVTLGSDRARPDTESQGLATVIRPSGGFIRYTGIGTIPSDVRSRGWNHVGDPGSRQGFYVEPYQSDSLPAKMFRVQAPGGAWAEYTHRLVPGEAHNNSFATLSPDGRWLVSGEWGDMTRLLVFPSPGIAFTTPAQDLPTTAAIRLDRTVTNIQGCDFFSATRLLCTSDGLGKSLLQLDLSAPLSRSDTPARVTVLGGLPLRSGCSGTFEVEGIDYDTRDGTLRVVVLSPGFCLLIDSKTWRFRLG